MLLTKFKNISRALLQSWGTPAAKRKLWNGEFSGGRWDYIESTPGDCVYPIVEKYARGGTILDLGCGSGNTGTELNESAYREYIGIDISDVAADKATQRSVAAGRSSKNRYFQGDIFSYEPAQQCDVILFRESIMYVPQVRIGGMLKRYCNHLTKQGVFVVRMCDREEYKPITNLIEASFSVIEAYLPSDAKTIVLVFR